MNSRVASVYDGRLKLVEGGEWDGWYHWTGDEPFEDHVGPFYVRSENGENVCGFRPERKNLNGFGAVHGGALLSFADFALFMLARPSDPSVAVAFSSVTVTLNAEFIASAPPSGLLTARGAPVGGGKKLVFVRGLIVAGQTPVLAFSGTIRRVTPTG